MMRKKWMIALLTIAYVALVTVLFGGIKATEAWVRDAWYDTVTRRTAARIAGVPIDRCILGAYRPEVPYVFDAMRSFEDSLGVKFTLTSLYQAWGEESAFPVEQFDAVNTHGCVPLLTWEPWVTDFTLAGLKSPGTREKRYLRDIGAGVYDFHLIPWAKAAVTWGKPFFLRFAHEMSNPQYPWTPLNDNTAEDYIRAWWRVHHVFDSLGATNAIWVWSPYRADDMVYWPGDSMVDWTAIDVFNYGDLMTDGTEVRWRTFDQLTSPLYRALTPLRKPIMIAEVGCSDLGGDRAVWYREMFAQVGTKFTGVKALVFFENPADRTSGRHTIDWTIGTNSEIMAEARNAAGTFAHLSDYSRRLQNTNH